MRCNQCGHEFPDNMALKMHLFFEHGLNENPPGIAESLIILVILTIAAYLGGVFLGGLT
jgi:hypothetical protein